jgi:hypothetical protein
MKTLTGLIAATLIPGVAMRAEPPRRPNVVFILADDKN